MTARITTTCGACDHSTGKTVRLCRCEKLGWNVTKDYLEVNCPLPAINGRIITGPVEIR